MTRVLLHSSAAASINDLLSTQFVARGWIAPDLAVPPTLRFGDATLQWSHFAEAFFLPTVIAFWMWILRASERLSCLVRRPEYSAKEAVGWWFVPIAHVFMPLLVLRSLWRQSHGGVDTTVPKLPLYIGAWWALWIIGLTLSWSPDLFTASAVALTPAALLAAQFVRDIQRAQSKRLQVE